MIEPFGTLQVYRAALDIIERFFTMSDDEAENIAPEVDAAGGFAFNTPDKPNVKYDF